MGEKIDRFFFFVGIQDRLVQTAFTDRCFLTMIEALNDKFGGSPFGPADMLLKRNQSKL